MSCGTKIDGRFHSYSERYDIAEALEREGEYRLADHVKRGDCLNSHELFYAEQALERQGKSRHFDYREDSCRCATEDEEGY